MGCAFPAPRVLRSFDLDLPGRKEKYLHAVADAALEGWLDAAALRSADAETAIRAVQEVEGLGPFAAELVVVRGANTSDVLPRHELRLDAEVAELYGPDHFVNEIAQVRRPFPRDVARHPPAGEPSPHPWWAQQRV